MDSNSEAKFECRVQDKSTGRLNPIEDKARCNSQLQEIQKLRHLCNISTYIT